MDAKNITADERVSASKKLQREDAVRIASAAKRVIIAKGKKLDAYPIAAGKAPAEAIDKMLGSTGNLRAPVLVVGDTVLVGFNAETYEEVFG